MTRRSIFRSLTACIVASSMEVMGWKMPLPPNIAEGWVWIVYHPIHLERLMPRWEWDGEEWKKPLPHGMGDNFKEIQSYETKP